MPVKLWRLTLDSSSPYWSLVLLGTNVTQTGGELNLNPASHRSLFNAEIKERHLLLCTLHRNSCTHLKDVGVFGQPQQLAGLPQSDAMQGGQIVAAGQDAHVAKLLLSENVAQGATAAQVALVHLQPVSLLVHF